MKKNDIEYLLIRAFSDLRNADETTIVISDVLTEMERDTITKRLAIALFLSKGKNYQDIKAVLHVTSAQIAKVQESLDTPGMKLAVEKLQVDEWAGGWAKKLAPLLEKVLGK